MENLLWNYYFHETVCNVNGRHIVTFSNARKINPNLLYTHLLFYAMSFVELFSVLFHRHLNKIVQMFKESVICFSV